MAVPTVNVTCTVTNQTGAVVPGATVTAQLTGIDLYGTNYIFPSVQSFVTDGAGLVTMPLFPNALGARRTAYQFIAIDPVTGRALINITAVVPNQNIDLSVLDAINRLPAYAPPLTQPFSATLASLASLGVAVGSILFGGSGQSVLQDNANLFWDNTAKRLGIGNAAPTVALDVTGAMKASLSIGSTIPGGTGTRTWWIDNNGGAGNITRIRSLGQDAATLGTFGFEVARSDNTGISQILGITASGAQVTGSLTASTSVVTPLVQASAGLVVNANAGDINFQTAGTRRWNILNSTSALQPDQDNVWNFGAATARIASGFFGTSVVTPLVGTDTAASLTFKTNGFAQWQISNLGGGAFVPMADNTLNLGDPAARIAKVFTPIIDSGTTGSLSLKTNNGTTQAEISHTGGTIVNWFQLTGNITTGAPQLRASGSDTDIDAIVTSKGAGSISLRTNNSAVVGLAVLHTASSNQNPTVTGGNGVNSKIGTTAGGLDFTSATIRYPNIGTTAVAANATLNAVGSNDLLRSTSSKRYKTEIEALSRDEALTLLRKLNPITYASLSEHDDPYLRHSGFIAEEVFDINPLFVSLSNKRPESVQYERLTVPLVAGWQDHDTRLAALEARIH